MRQNLGGHTNGNTLSALCKKQREANRKLRGLLVTAVIRGHPVGNLGVEDHLFGKLAKTRLYVPRGSIAVSGKDVTPVSLAVYCKAFLAQLNKCTKNGSIAVRVILHSLTDNVGYLGKTAVIHLEHGMQHAPLNRLESVHNMRYGPGQDYIRRVIQKPLLEHSGQLEFCAILSQKTVISSAGRSRIVQWLAGFIIVILIADVFNVVPFFAHYLLLFFVSEFP